MVSDQGVKRKANNSAHRRNVKHDRKKFKRITNNAAPKRTNITSGLAGVLFTCGPRQERRAMREGVLLLHRHYEALTAGSTNTTTAAAAAAAAPAEDRAAVRDEGTKKEETKAGSVLSGLDDELAQLRENDRARKDDSGLFHGVETNMDGSIFIQLSNPPSHPPDAHTLLARIVERALCDARETGNPGTKFCIRMLPIFTTCYAAPADVEAAVERTARAEFERLDKLKEGNATGSDEEKKQEGTLSFRVDFRHRCNSGVHRNDFIPKIAEAILNMNPKYKVDLRNPDVTVVVEILKSCCYLGYFGPYADLAKLNLREAANPTPKPQKVVSKPGETDTSETKDEETKQKQTVNGQPTSPSNGDASKTPELNAEKVNSTTKDERAVEKNDSVLNENAKQSAAAVANNEEKREQNDSADKKGHSGEQIQADTSNKSSSTQKDSEGDDKLVPQEDAVNNEQGVPKGEQEATF